VTNIFGYPHIGQLKKGCEVFDAFQRAQLQPPNAYPLYQTHFNGSGEAEISQNNRFMLVTDRRVDATAAAVANGLGFSRQVKFNQITDTRTTLEFNIHLEFMHTKNIEAFVGLDTGTTFLRKIPDANKRYCGVKIDTSTHTHLVLGNANTEFQEITDLKEFEPIHYRLHILWKNNDNVILSLYRGDDFKTLIGTHTSSVFASEASAEIETFFLHWFVRTTDKEEKTLLTKGWWVKAL